MSSVPEAASLTSALLVRKGRAVPAGYVSLASAVRAPNAIEEEAPVAPAPAPAPAAKPRTARRPRKKDPRARISLRLDDERHLKLKLTAAHLHMKLQEIVIAALDGYLEQIGPAVMNGNCACLDGGNCGAREGKQGCQ
ncbi:MAG: hypothetical protein ABFS41_17305 [Myxococcota bacterium]